MHQKIESNKICPVFLGLKILSESSNFFVEFLRISFLKKRGRNQNERVPNLLWGFACCLVSFVGMISCSNCHWLLYSCNGTSGCCFFQHCSKFIQKSLGYQRGNEGNEQVGHLLNLHLMGFQLFFEGCIQRWVRFKFFLASLWGPCDTKHWLSTVWVCATCCQRWADKSQTKRGRYMSQHSMLAVGDTVTSTLRKVHLALKSTLAKVELPRFLLSFCDFASQKGNHTPFNEKENHWNQLPTLPCFLEFVWLPSWVCDLKNRETPQNGWFFYMENGH